jgi:cell division septation protein DedD
MVRRIENIDKEFYNRECHIIGIGVDKYRSKDWLPLKNCESDVEHFINKVCSSFKNFEDSKDYVNRLFNSEATRELIEVTIKNKINILKSHQNLIIYFAGHGSNYEKAAYLAPHDAQTNYKNPDKSKLISFTELFNWIDNKESLHIVLILDCCYGGRIMNTKRASQDKYSYEEFLDEHIGGVDFEAMMTKKSAWVITSGSDNQKVDDGDKNGSPFSQVLMIILDSCIKFNRSMSIAQIGSTLKTRFGSTSKTRLASALKIPFSKNQKPNYKHLNNIKGYADIGGEFVFVPISTITESEQEVQIVPVVPESKVVTVLVPEIVYKPIIDKPESEREKIVKKQYESQRYSKFIDTTSNISKTPSFFKKNIGKAWLFFLTLSVLIILIYKIISLNMDSIMYYINSNRTPLPVSSIDIEPQPPLPPQILPPEIITVTPPIEPPPPKPKIHKPNTDKILHFDEDSNNDEQVNVVFVGSFQNKNNAEALLERLQKIGYQKAEIVMKESLPYAVVVTGFYQFNSSAKAEVKALKKSGIEVYYSKADFSKIYRK